MATLENLIIELSASTVDLEAGLNRATAAARAAGRAMETPIKLAVDTTDWDLAITKATADIDGLNKHLALNPLKLKVDTSELTKAYANVKKMYGGGLSVGVSAASGAGSPPRGNSGLSREFQNLGNKLGNGLRETVAAQNTETKVSKEGVVLLQELLKASRFVGAEVKKGRGNVLTRAIGGVVSGAAQGYAMETRRQQGKFLRGLTDSGVDWLVEKAAESGIKVNTSFISSLIDELSKNATKAAEDHVKNVDHSSLGVALAKSIGKIDEAFVSELYAKAKSRRISRKEEATVSRTDDLINVERSLSRDTVELYARDQEQLNARRRATEDLLQLTLALEKALPSNVANQLRSVSGATPTDTASQQLAIARAAVGNTGDVSAVSEQLEAIKSMDAEASKISDAIQQNNELLKTVRQSIREAQGESPDQAFLKILRELNEGVLPDQAQIPRVLVSDERLRARGAEAIYNPDANAIIVTKALKQALEADNLSDQDLRLIAHEIQHAIDLSFGDSRGRFLSRSGVLGQGSGDVDQADLQDFLRSYEVIGDRRIELEANAESRARELVRRQSGEFDPDAISTRDPLLAEMKGLRNEIAALVRAIGSSGGAINAAQASGPVDASSFADNTGQFIETTKDRIKKLYESFNAEIETGDLDKANEAKKDLKVAGDKAKDQIDKLILELRDYGEESLDSVYNQLISLKGQITRKQKQSKFKTSALTSKALDLENVIGGAGMKSLEDELASFNLFGVIRKAAGYKKEDFQSMKGFLGSDKTRDILKEIVVNGVGAVAGGAAAGATGSPVAALGTEFGASLITRKAVTDTEALIDAYLNMAEDELDDVQNFFVKLGLIIQKAKQEAENKTESYNKDINADVIGFGIGNSAASALGAAGVNIPLEGAVVAMATTQKAVAGKLEIQKTINEKTQAITKELKDSLNFLKHGGSELSLDLDVELASLPEETLSSYRNFADILAQINNVKEQAATTDSAEELASLSDVLDGLIEKAKQLAPAFSKGLDTDTEEAKNQAKAVADALSQGIGKITDDPKAKGLLTFMDLMGGKAAEFSAALKEPQELITNIVETIQNSKGTAVFVGVSAAALAGLILTTKWMRQLAAAVRDVGKQRETLNAALDAGIGRGHRAYFRELYDLTTSLGTSFNQAAIQYKSFSGAFQGTALQDLSDEMFNVVQKVGAVRKLTEQEMDSISLAITQMASKGVISMEELRQQLSERLPGAMSTATRAMGMTAQEFNQAVSSGNLRSEEFLPKFLFTLEQEADAGLGRMPLTYEDTEAQVANAMGRLQNEMAQQTLGFDKLVNSALAKALNSASGFGVILGDIFAAVNVTLATALIPSLVIVTKKLGLLAVASKVATAALVPLASGLGVLTALVATVGIVRAAFDSGSDSIRKNTDDITAAIESMNGALEETAKVSKTSLNAYGRLADVLNKPIQRLAPDTFTFADLDEQAIKVDVGDQIGRGDQVFTNMMSALSDSEGLELTRERLTAIDKEIESLNAKKLALQIDKADPRELIKVQAEISRLTKDRVAANAEILPGGVQAIELTLKSLRATREELESLERTNGFEFGTEIAGITAQIEDLENGLTQLNDTLDVTNNNVAAFENLASSIADARQELSLIQAETEVQVGRETLGLRGRELETTTESITSQGLRKQQQALQSLQSDYKAFFEGLTTSEIQSIETLLGTTIEEATAGQIAVAERRAGSTDGITSDSKEALALLRDRQEVELELLGIEREILANQQAQIESSRQFASSLRDFTNGYRGFLNGVEDVQLEAQRFEVDFAREIDDFNRTQFREVRGISESWEDLFRDMERQGKAAQKELSDIAREVEAIELAGRLRNEFGQGSFVDGMAEVFTSISNAISEYNGESESLALQRLDAEEETLQVARQVRALQEQQEDMERNRLIQVDQLRRQQDDFARQQERQWQDILVQYADMERQAAELGVSLDEVGVQVARQGEGLVEAIHDLATNLSNMSFGGGYGTGSLQGILTDPAIQEGIDAASQFTTQANMCAASIKAFTKSLGINSDAMDLTADSAKRMGTVMTDWSKLEPGDLIGWSGGPSFGDEHIGMFLGGDDVFHQSGSRGLKPGVYDDLDYFKQQRGAYFVRIDDSRLPQGASQPLANNFGSNPAYGRLNELSTTLQNHPGFNPNSAKGRAALATAMIIAAGESGSSWLRQGSGVDLFGAMGGTGNAMRGFAQFHTGFFDSQTSGQAGYIDKLAGILSGNQGLPRGEGRFNPGELANLVQSGEILKEQDLLDYIQKAININDWHGVHESGGGGARIRQSGVLSEALKFIRGSSDVPGLEPITTVAGNTVGANASVPELPSLDSYRAEVGEAQAEIAQTREQTIAAREEAAKVKLDNRVQEALASARGQLIGLRDTVRDSLRDIRGLDESTLSILQNVKGYLTVEERVQQARNEANHELRNQLEQLNDANDEYNRKITASVELLEKLDDEKANLLAQGANPVEVEELGQLIQLKREQLQLLAEESVSIENNIAKLQEFEDVAGDIAADREREDIGLSQLESVNSFWAEYNRAMADVSDPISAIMHNQAAAALEVEARFASLRLEVQRMGDEYGLSAQEVQEMNAALDNQQLAELRQAFVDTNPVAQSFKDNLKGIFDGTKDAGEALRDFALSLANLAAEWAANQITNFLFGGGFGGGGIIPGSTTTSGGGGAGGIVGGLLGIVPSIVGGFAAPAAGAVASAGPSSVGFFRNGGEVQNYADGGTISGLGMSVMAAMNREGAGAVPIVAHAGEQILTTMNGDAQYFRSLERSGEWARMKRDGISNYDFGGNLRGQRYSDASGKSVIYNTSMIVQSPDANSFNKSRDQIITSIETQNRKNYQRNGRS